MVDKSIGELVAASQINDNDLFVLEQSGEAKKLLGNLLKQYITRNVMSVSVSALPPDSEPTVSYDPNTGTLELGIPRGESGESSAGYVSGIVKGDGAGNVSRAIPGTDFAAMSNLPTRNLLDNPWFTVNQRNANAPDASGYFVDRWISGAGVTVDQSGSLNFSATSDYILQKLEDKLKAMLVGKSLTASILFSDGTIEAGDQVYTGNDGNQTYFFAGTYFQGVKQPNGDILFWCANPTKQVKAVKLELGSVSTLANDTAPNYSEELAKCQRYFLRRENIWLLIGSGTQNGRYEVAPFQFPTTMRTNPSISTKKDASNNIGIIDGYMFVTDISEIALSVFADTNKFAIDAKPDTNQAGKVLRLYDVSFSADL